MYTQAAQGDSCLSAVVTGEQSQGIVSRYHIFYGCGGEGFRRIGFIFIYTAVYIGKYYLAAFSDIFKSAEVGVIIMTGYYQVI